MKLLPLRRRNRAQLRLMVLRSPKLAVKIGMALIVALSVPQGLAQVVLTGSGYSQSFDTISAGLPSGWDVRTGSTSASLGSVATFVTTTTTWTDTTGQFENCAAAESPATSSDSTTTQSGRADRAVAVRQSGSFGDPGASFNFHINASGVVFSGSGTALSLKMQDLNIQGRSTTWSIQYGIGASPSSWNTITTWIDPNTTWGSQTITALGSALSGLSGQSDAWIRIVALSITTPSSGSRTKIALDDFSLTYSAAGPSTPIANAATSVTSSGFTANWSASSGAVGYYLDLSTATNFASYVSGYNNLDVGNVTSKIVTGLSSSTTYYYRVRAYDVNKTTSSNSSPISVTTAAPPVPKLTITLPGQSAANTGTPTTQTAGTAFNVTVTATTDGTTTDFSYTGSHDLSFSASSGSSVSPANASVTFNSGVATVSLTLTNTTPTTITVTNSTIAGTASSSLSINPDAINSYLVSAPLAQARGVAFNVLVTAKDAYGNTVTTDNSTAVTMSSSSGNVQFVTNPKTLAGGTFTVSATDNTSETTTITATDGNAKTGTSSSITVGVPKFRSKNSGNWNATTTWEESVDGGATWVDAFGTPTSSDGAITIRNGHTVAVSASVAIDEVTVDAGGQITINLGQTLTLAAANALTVNGTVLNQGNALGINSGATWKVNAGGTYIHNSTSAIATALSAAVLDPSGTIDYRGSSTLGPNVSISGRTYGNLAFESTSGLWFPSVSGATDSTINGHLYVGVAGAGNVYWDATYWVGALLNKGDISVGAGSSLYLGQDTVTLRGNVLNDGTISFNPSSGTCIFDGNATVSGASAPVFGGGFTINAGKTVTLSQSIDIRSGKTGTVNGKLAGTGTIGASGGALTVSASGTLSPGTASSTGTLTLGTAPTFSGTNFLKIDRNGGSPLADKIVLTAGTLNYGGVLTVSNASSTSFAGGEVFDLFDAPAFSGAFTATNLPALGSGLNWYLGSLNSDGTIRINQSPIPAASKTFTNVATLTLKIPLTSLVAGATDADGDAVSLTGINLQTANGTTLVTNSTYIFYTNAPTMPDSFTYTISDGHGGTATGVVNVVTLTSVTGQASAPTVNGRFVSLHFAGHPGWTYSIERSLNDLSSWTTIWTTNAPTNGAFDYPDDVGDPPPASVYYRLRWTP